MTTTMKTVCHICSVKIEILEALPFSSITCQSCGAQSTVPEVLGDYILTDKIDENNSVTVYKGFTVSGEILSVKKLKLVSDFNDDYFVNLKRRLKLQNSDSICYQILKVEEDYLMVRPWLQMCVGMYVEDKRPKSEQAILFIQQLSQLFLESSEALSPINDITLNNVYLNDLGNLVIADRGFEESPQIGFKESLLCFQNLISQFCCGVDFPLQKEFKLTLRDEAAEGLTVFLKRLFDKKSFTDFRELNESAKAIGARPKNL